MVVFRAYCEYIQQDENIAIYQFHKFLNHTAVQGEETMHCCMVPNWKKLTFDSLCTLFQQAGDFNL